MILFYQNFFNYFESYNTSILFFNLFSYLFILINIFLILFLFDLKYIKTLNELKFLKNLNIFNIHIIVIFLSFAGTPPLLGFVSKFLIFIVIFIKNNFFIFLIFIFFNFFSMYFYLQNLRFLISKELKNYLILKKNFLDLNFNYIFILNFFNFFNILFIFYFEDFYNYLNFLIFNF